MWVAPSVVGFGAVAAATPSVPYTNFYTEDFQGSIGNAQASWSTVQTEVAPADPNRRFLGRFLNQTVTLTLGPLPAHDCLCLRFEFFVIESWDGNHPRYGGPDLFTVGVDGVPQLSDSFGQHPFGVQWSQTYGPDPINLPGTGRSETDTLGYNRWGNSVYNIELCDIAHTASAASITFSAQGLQSLSDESWGIDNLEVSYA